MSADEEMEKRGVSCHCEDCVEVNGDDMIKTADGYVCKHCGRKIKHGDQHDNLIDK